MSNLLERLKDGYAEKIFSEKNVKAFPNIIGDLKNSMGSNVYISQLTFDEVHNIVNLLSFSTNARTSVISPDPKISEIYNLFND